MNHIKIHRITSGAAPFVGGTAAILLAAAIVSAPESSFAASLQGLKLWWTLVFPALLPFLILSEMLAASGVIHSLGVLLEPLMKRIFRLPGASGWTLVLGMTAGFPAGAGAVMQLHKQGSITDKEAGRLASLAHYASPVTLLIVVGAAFLHSPASGYALLGIHWLAGLSAGCTSALIGGRSGNMGTLLTEANRKKTSLPRRVYRAAVAAREQDGRSFGRLLGESVSSAVQNLMIVGGYMIIFAVVINITASMFPQLPQALAAGVLEIHLGAHALSAGPSGLPSFSSADLLRAALLSAALGWSGICGQLQALTLLKQAGVRFLPYAANRLLHGIYAFLFTLLLWKPLLNLQTAVLPVATVPEDQLPGIAAPATVWRLLPQILGLQSLILLLLLALSAVVYVMASFRRPSA
ncbi:nucleoside recognition domain-containing protein [Paenibacillus graminis]|uniref:nucleoside recognition domain-containing protein n=1 Tax=Paenibacillus graminis TaxID=189425 RepID=UPI002DBDF59B|nr:nucleoside recognition domain-containing protein [Paenibacillus graminis]MEC0172575.1 nucleoside recognition domain-containing protein [Paenibacillus graminis]